MIRGTKWGGEVHRLLPNHFLEIFPQSFVLTINKTTFLSSSEQGFIGVEDKAVGDVVASATNAGGFVVFRDGEFVRDDAAGGFVVGEVFADEDTDIVEFQALGCVDAADFLEGTRIDRPNLVVGQVPFCLEAAGEIDVYVATAVLDIPVIAIAGDHASLVIDCIFLPQGIAHLDGIVEDTEVVIQFG